MASKSSTVAIVPSPFISKNFKDGGKILLGTVVARGTEGGLSAAVPDEESEDEPP
jgi:hypothetical protein